MKHLLILPFLTLFLNANGQVLGGTLVSEGRKLLTETDFTVEGTVEGYAIYEIAVGRDGIVSSMKLEDTNIKSTPTKVIVRNYLTGFTFTPATNAPPFQHVRIKITSVN